MDENRVIGTARDIGGKAQESFGRIVGDATVQGKGIANQVQGTAQDLYGRARESASNVVDAAATSASNMRRQASSYEGSLRHTIENQPYLAVVLALGLGWILGRMREPI
ncbi:MAG TPA: CsbD family protein [Beijerinckiaceae bacterium]|jgi:uncharacterized protein YjbJ (UPF0337 family)|nr:CsbD family protein [Beijerinckiaceae bacterium]